MQIFEKDLVLVSFDDDSEMVISVARLISSSENVDVAINDDMAAFFQTELGLNLGSCRRFASDANTANEVIRLLFGIESEESLKAGDMNKSDRGGMASLLINLIHGSYSSTEFGAEIDKGAKVKQPA
jgi:hypothetical protein